MAPHACFPCTLSAKGPLLGWGRMAEYGASILSLATKHVQGLRSGAMRGIGAQKPGANPLLHLSCVEHPSADPGFSALLSWLKELGTGLSLVRRMRLPRLPIPLLAFLLDRCHQVAITWDACSVTALACFALSWPPLKRSSSGSWRVGRGSSPQTFSTERV